MTEFTIHLPSGRTLEASEDGDATGIPTFSLPGTPGSRMLYSPHIADAKKRGIKLISYNRPGYGGPVPLSVEKWLTSHVK